MARMIPLHIPPLNPSRAEQRLFRTFETECPADWIVLHSLDLARREHTRFGEADFVALVPGHGIVCVEAKTYLQRTGQGMWKFAPDAPATEKNPFSQANRAKYRVLEWLGEHGMPDLLGASVVVVPGMEVAVRGDPSAKSQIEWAPHQLIDRSRLNAQSLETLLCDALTAERSMMTHKPGALTRSQAETAVRLLRAEVESYESPRARLERQVEEARIYTDEQYRVIDQLGDNPRLLVDGLAGTGKTLLAIESARRAVGQGRRVLLLCFNRLLAEWLATQTAPLGDRCVTSALHEHLQVVAGDTEVPQSDAGGDAASSEVVSAYWNRELPMAALDVLTSDVAPSAMLFDEIIVDEAQDVIGNGTYLDVLDASLAQGLAAGRWRLFGDFGRQAIFGALDEEPRRAFERRLGYEPPLVSLRENCRNTPRVAHLADAVAGDGEGASQVSYREIRRDDDGHDPIIRFYTDEIDQRAQLIEVLEQLHAEGFRGSEIVVLSRRGYTNCAACGIDTQPWKDCLRPFEEADEGMTRFCSIYKFKGLEAPAIVVTDIDPPEEWPEWNVDGDVRSLIYVGATRSISRLALLAHEHWRGVLPLGALDEMGV